MCRYTLDTIDDDDIPTDTAGSTIAESSERSSSRSTRLSGSLATQAAEVSTSADSRNSRLEMESYLKNAIGRDVVGLATDCLHVVYPVRIA